MHTKLNDLKMQMLMVICLPVYLTLVIIYVIFLAISLAVSGLSKIFAQKKKISTS